MAAPVIRSTSSGVSSGKATGFDITLPATIVAGDTILCFISVSPTGWVYQAPTSTGAFDVSKSYYPINSFRPCMTIIINENALGGGSDYLRVESFYCYWDRGVVLRNSMHSYYWAENFLTGDLWYEYHRKFTKIAYVCYAISGMKKDCVGRLYGNRFIEDSFIAGATVSNWNLTQSPIVDDSIINDYLWIAAVGSKNDDIATVAPTGFSGLITAQATTSDNYFDCSMTTCSRTTSGVSLLDPGGFTAPATDWAGVLRRLPPEGSTPDPPPDPPSGSAGVGFHIYNKQVREEPVGSIIVTPVNQYYNDDGTPDTDLNYYGYYIEVESTGSWTCTWNIGTYFTAGQYSGDEGVTYVAINCVGTNESAGSYTDTLVFDGPGIASDSVNVEQYAAP